MALPPPQVPPGWYEREDGRLHYWNGAAWTNLPSPPSRGDDPATTDPIDSTWGAPTGRQGPGLEETLLEGKDLIRNLGGLGLATIYLRRSLSRYALPSDLNRIT